MCIYIYIYIYIHTCVCIYIYIHIHISGFSSRLILPFEFTKSPAHFAPQVLRAVRSAQMSRERLWLGWRVRATPPHSTPLTESVATPTRLRQRERLRRQLLLLLCDTARCSRIL